MRALMAKNQRDYIVSHVKNKMVEWGSGGSTIYFVENLQGKHLTSIEHDSDWYCKVKKLIKSDNHNYLLINGKHIGKNATPFEENPSGLNEYISHIVDDADTVLIDGVARSSCLMMSYIKYPKANIFLHDCNRDWYDHAIKLYPNKKIIKSVKGDYPPDLLHLFQ